MRPNIIFGQLSNSRVTHSGDSGKNQENLKKKKVFKTSTKIKYFNNNAEKNLKNLKFMSDENIKT